MTDRPRKALELVVPAYNEEKRILRCLDSMLEAELPADRAWRCWTIACEGSDDGTVEAARGWADRRGACPVRVVGGTERLGKATKLSRAHRRIVAAGDPHSETVVVVLDADAAVAPDSLLALLEPFATSDVSVVWGADRVDRREPKRAASSFQMSLAEAIGRARGSSAPRAYGRFFAYRASDLASFCWEAGQVDDIQLSSYVTTAGLRCRSAWDARVLVTPAGSWRDFYLQTYRCRRAEEKQKLECRQSPTTAPEGPRLWRAVARTAWRDPTGAAAYVTARTIALGMHAVRPEPHRSAWRPTPTTKS